MSSDAVVIATLNLIQSIFERSLTVNLPSFDDGERGHLYHTIYQAFDHLKYLSIFHLFGHNFFMGKL